MRVIKYHGQITALGFLQALERNQPTGLCFHLFAMIQTCAYLYSRNFTPQVKEARNQSQIFNRKSISRNTTHRQSYYLIQIEFVSY